MKKADFIFALFFCLVVIPFMPFPFMKLFQQAWLYNEDYWVYTSFLKFAILATMGEVIGLRIRKGAYTESGFGLIPRMIVWGFLGLTIKVAFVVFGAGVPALADKYFGISGAKDSMAYKDIFEASEHGLFTARLLSAFMISTIMNLFYAPAMMVFHKITDLHIIQHGGKLNKFFSPIDFASNFKKIDWNLQWGFIFKKTIPLFWIPMQTITFAVASEYRVAIAAFLGIILGVILSVGNPANSYSPKGFS